MLYNTYTAFFISHCLAGLGPMSGGRRPLAAWRKEMMGLGEGFSTKHGHSKDGYNIIYILILYCIVFYYILFYSILFKIFYSILLSHIVLYCIMLCYIILYDVMGN